MRFRNGTSHGGWGDFFSRNQAPSAIQTSVKEAPMGFFDKLRDAPDICVRGISDFYHFLQPASGGTPGRSSADGSPRQVSERRCIARVQATYSSPLSYSVA